jgi:rhodanese-related sulfurtransferase
MKYTLTNQEDLSEIVLDIEAENPNEVALKEIGYSVHCFAHLDSDEIKQYNCIDNSDNSVVFYFYEGWRENACLAALNELGYDLSEGDWTQPENIETCAF